MSGKYSADHEWAKGLLWTRLLACRTRRVRDPPDEYADDHVISLPNGKAVEGTWLGAQGAGGTRIAAPGPEPGCRTASAPAPPAAAANHAWRTRTPKIVVGLTRMKCAGMPSIHGMSPVPMNGARSASVSR